MSEKSKAVVILAFVGLVVVGGIIVGGLGTDPAQNVEPNQTQSDGGDSSPDSGSDSTDGADSALSVQNAGLPGSVDEDETLQPTITLLNEGESERQQTVHLRVDVDGDGEWDRTADTRETTIPAGQTSEVSFTLDPPASGEYQYGVVTGGETQMDWSVNVLKPPTFVPTEVSVAESPVQGENATVSARVVNEGEYGGDGTAEVHFGGPESNTETADSETISLAAGDSTTISMTVPTTDVSPGTHELTVETETDSATEQIRVLTPATFEVGNLTGSLNVSRGSNATVAAEVTNTGDVPGRDTVALGGLGDEPLTKSVALDSNESETVEFNVSTDDFERGSYFYTLATSDDEVASDNAPENGTSTTLQVREAHFRVSELRGNETIRVGDEMIFAANVTNIGEARATQPVDVRIDLSRGPEPEELGLVKNVTLDPGEETAVRFQVPYMEDPDPLTQVEDLPTGSYIYGIYSEDSNQTSVFDARNPVSTISSSGGGDGSSADDSSDTDDSLSASLDEISQEKYGLFYDSLSGETRMQIEEIHERQPFAGDLGITDVLTREELARQEYGLDVKRGDNFDFNGLDIDIQQQIEADFDAQFTSQTGDRIESWDELAQEEFDTTYDNLTEEQQGQIRTQYQEQFD